MSTPDPPARGLSGIFGPSAASGRSLPTPPQYESNGVPPPEPAAAAADRASDLGTGGRILVRDPRQVDMLLLAVLHGRPRTRSEAVESIRRRTGGRLVPIHELVLSRIAYLERNHLVCRAGEGPRFRSTGLGDRVLLGRLRELESLIRGVEALVDDE